MTTFTAILYAASAAILVLMLIVRLRYGPYLGHKWTSVQRFRWQISLLGLALVCISIALYIHPAPLGWLTWALVAALITISIVRFIRTARTL